MSAFSANEHKASQKLLQEETSTSLCASPKQRKPFPEETSNFAGHVKARQGLQQEETLGSESSVAGGFQRCKSQGDRDI